MSLKSLYDDGITIYRVLSVRDDAVFVIDCVKRTMPVWLPGEKLSKWQAIEEQALHERTGVYPVHEDTLSKSALATAHKRYSIIAPVVAVVADKKKRNDMIEFATQNSGISKQTIRQYLCLYLAFQTVTMLAPVDKVIGNILTKERKWMRWALNKFFYTQRANSLRTAYLYLLKDKYTDENGLLREEHPSFYQFRYFYRKTKSKQNYLISRKGLTDYQRNYRPLLGEGVAEFANHVGIAMLDSTICDIYLVDENGNLLGRPVLTACIDAYSQMCCGFALTWEGGMSSLRVLLQNVIAEKVTYCKKHGILISQDEWECHQLPGEMMTDRGMEYCSENFEQLSEIGVTIINLPSYRPELKGVVEKFFDIVQNYFKPFLRGKGVIEPDYQQRGAHDYRLDACLTLDDFKKVLLRCIVHYNCRRKIVSVNYTEEMLNQRVEPFPNQVWNYGKEQVGANLISVDETCLTMTLLPRTNGRFTRKGLQVNGLRYKQENFTERFLKGGDCVVAYNPDNVSFVWLLEKGQYVKFDLIESRYKNKSLLEVEYIQTKIKELTDTDEDKTIQAEIDLQKHISVIGDAAKMMRLKSTGDASDV